MVDQAGIERDGVMRECICVSGQMRAAEAGLSALRDAIGDRSPVVVYSVWNRFGQKVTGTVYSQQLPRILSPDAVTAFPSDWLGWQSIWSALPILAKEKASLSGDDGEDIRRLILSYFPDAIVDIEDDALLDLSFDQSREDANSIRMLYKVWRANQIKRRIEARTGKFDLVYRLRPDVAVTTLASEEIIGAASAGTVFVDYALHGSTFIGDAFAVGSSATMDCYASLFGRAVHDQADWHLIHTDLARLLTAADLRIEAYPHFREILRDRTSSARDMEAILKAQKVGPDLPWSDVHDITLLAMRAAAALTEGDPGACVTMLRELEGRHRLSALDGYFGVLGQAHLELGQPVAAAICMLLSMQASRPDGEGQAQRFIDPRLGDTLLAVASRLFGAGRADGRHDVARAMTLTSEAEWLAEKIAAVSGLGDLVPTLEHALAHFLAIRLLEAQALDLALAAIRGESGELALALAVSDWALQDVSSWYLIADALKGAGHYREAEHWQNRAVQAEPNHAGANRQLAEICLHLDDVEKGLTFAERALELAPQDDSHGVLTQYARYRITEQGPGASKPQAIDPALWARYRSLPHFTDYYQPVG